MREQSRRDAVAESQDQEIAPVAEPESHTRFVGGAAPPVQTGFADQHATASQLAYNEDPHEKELKQKVGALVATKFGGDYKKAFAAYDHDGSGSINEDELKNLLSDAGVGNGFTRGAWASGIIKKLDSNKDGAIEWNEFESVFTGTA